MRTINTLVSITIKALCWVVIAWALCDLTVVLVWAFGPILGATLILTALGYITAMLTWARPRRRLVTGDVD